MRSFPDLFSLTSNNAPLLRETGATTCASLSLPPGPHPNPSRSGNLEWTRKLEWTGKAAYNLAKPKNFISGKKGKSAGKTRSVGEGAGTLTYLQVYDAGHMVPFDKPAESLDFFTKWIKDQPLA